MKTISTHVIFFIGTLLLTGLLIWAADGSIWRNLVSLDAGTQIVLGLSFVLVLSALWSLLGGPESASYKLQFAIRRRFAWERKRLEIFPASPNVHADVVLPLWLRFIGVLLLTAVLCVQWISPKSLNRLQDPAALGLMGGDRFCPDQAEGPKLPVAVKTGCELVLRAFELGYTKDLGDCQENKPSEQSEKEVCQDRHRDEPLLHYYGRQMSGWIDVLSPSTVAHAMAKEIHDSEAASRELSQKALREARQLIGTPRSSHHIWTNLSEPSRGMSDRILKAFYPGYCEQRPAEKPSLDVTGALGDGVLFAWIIEQLLFDETYVPAVLSCREFHIHWQAPVDFCETLAKNPAHVLEAEGIAGDLQQVRARLTAGENGKDMSHGLEKSMSFQCIMAVAGTSEAKRWPFQWDGFSGHIEQRTWPINHASLATLYGEVAGLLAPGFSYHHLQDGTVRSRSKDLQNALAQKGFPFLRMSLLQEGDVFLGKTWFTSVEGATEVYPWDGHSRPFIERFRQVYRMKRGRL